MAIETTADPDPSAVARHLEALPPQRRGEAETLIGIMGRATGASPRLWGGRIVGFGRYDYTYKSGHSGSWFLTGFAVSKARLSIHILPQLAPFEAELARLGPHKAAVSCLYVTRLERIDLDVLAEIVTRGVAAVRDAYPAHSPTDSED